MLFGLFNDTYTVLAGRATGISDNVSESHFGDVWFMSQPRHRPSRRRVSWFNSVKGKVHPCTGTEALYRPYGLYRASVLYKCALYLYCTIQPIPGHEDPEGE